jgi:hypothetical protein
LKIKNAKLNKASMWGGKRSGEEGNLCGIEKLIGMNFSIANESWRFFKLQTAPN